MAPFPGSALPLGLVAGPRGTRAQRHVPKSGFLSLPPRQMTRHSSARCASGSSPPTATSPSTRRNTGTRSSPVRSAARCSTARTSCSTTRGGTWKVGAPAGLGGRRPMGLAQPEVLLGTVASCASGNWSRLEHSTGRGEDVRETGLRGTEHSQSPQTVFPGSLILRRCFRYE